MRKDVRPLQKALRNAVTSVGESRFTSELRGDCHKQLQLTRGAQLYKRPLCEPQSTPSVAALPEKHLGRKALNELQTQVTHDPLLGT